MSTSDSVPVPETEPDETAANGLVAPDAEAGSETGAETGTDAGDISSEAEADIAGLAAQLESAASERDDYLDQLQRQRAEFQNFRRRADADRAQQVSAGVSRIVDSLLPVLDGCDAAMAQGLDDVAPVAQALMVALGKAGLERIDTVGTPFDPNQHEAVIVEPAPADSAEPDSGASSCDDTAQADGAATDTASADDETSVHDGAQMVIDELRSGYRFDGRVLRAAMVKVRAG